MSMLGDEFFILALISAALAVVWMIALAALLVAWRKQRKPGGHVHEEKDG
jgi:hypothetical protein